MQANLKHSVITVLALLLAACSGGGGGSTATGTGSRSVGDQGFEELSAGHYAEAQKLLEEAIAQRPNDPYVQLNLGAAYDHLGQSDKARAYYQKVLVTGQNTVPGKTTNGVKGKSLAEVAQDNINLMKK